MVASRVVPRMGVNEMGISFGNATARPFDDSPNYAYANTQAFKQHVQREKARKARKEKARQKRKKR